MCSSRRVHLFTNTLTTKTTKCVPNLSWCSLFGCLLFSRDSQFMNDKIPSVDSHTEKVAQPNINSHRIVASFARECANSTVIIRIVGFQFNLYICLILLHFGSLKFTLSAFMRFMWLGWVPIPKTHIFHVLFDTRHIPIWQTQKRIFAFESHFVFAIYSHIYLLHSICKRFLHIHAICILQNDQPIIKCMLYIFTCAIFVYALAQKLSAAWEIWWYGIYMDISKERRDKKNRREICISET